MLVSTLVFSVLMVSCLLVQANTEEGDSCDVPRLASDDLFYSSSFHEFLAKQVERNIGEGKAVTSHSCIRDVNEIANIRKLLIVDFRSTENFDSGHLPGSINLPKYQLKTKNTFKNGPILIVDEAINYLDNVPLCEVLPSIGFSEIYVLRGGYERWLAEKSKKPNVYGNENTKSDLSEISTIDFIRIAEKTAWLVLDFSGRSNSYPARVLTMAADNITEKSMLQVDEWFNNFTKDEGFSPQVLIFDEHGTDYSGISSSISPKILRNSYFLKGGLNAFDKELKAQRLIRDKKQVTTATRDLRCQ